MLRARALGVFAFALACSGGGDGQMGTGGGGGSAGRTGTGGAAGARGGAGGAMAGGAGGMVVGGAMAGGAGGMVGGAGGARTAGSGGSAMGGGASGGRDAGGAGGAVVDAGTGDGPAASPSDGAGAGRTTYVYVSGSNTNRIDLFTLDTGTGALAPKPAITGLSPGYLAFSPDKKFVYGPASTPTRVYAWAIDPATGALSRVVGDALTAGQGAAHIAVHPGGKFVLVPHFTSGDITVLPVTDTGGVAALVDMQKTAVEAHQVVTDRDGKFVYIPCRRGDAVMQYRFDPAGKLVPNDPPRVMSATGAGPRHMDFHPTGRWAVVLNELDGTMTSYRVDMASGTLSEPQTVSTVPAGVAETAAAHVLFHPSGRFVYGSNRTHNSVVVMRFDEATGQLEVLGHQAGAPDFTTPRDFGMDPEGRFLLVAGQASGTLAVYRIDPATGLLTRAGAPITGLGRPQFVGVIAP